MSKMERGCELCDGVAALHCGADEAYICWTCDAKVHSANFLVARHTRSVLCGTCGIPTSWRASGANPTPLTCLCADCSQGESQGECASHNVTGVLDNRKVTTRSCPTVGRSGSGYESGCSSSNPESCDDKVVDGDTIQVSPLPSTSQFSREDMECLTVDRSFQTSVSSGISEVKKKKTLGCCSLVSVPLSKQIATRTLEDVNRSVAQRQCDCNSDISSSSSRRANHANQDPSLESRDWNRSQLEYSSRLVTTFLLSSAKRQRMENRRQMRASFAGSQQVTPFSTSRLLRILAKWHWDLHLSSPGTVPLALRMFRKVSRALAPTVLSTSGMRVTLAACLRLAAGLDEAQITVPKASEVAACAGISTRRLAMTEIHLLALLGWRRFPLWAGART